MSDAPATNIEGRRILVVEDNYLLADEIREGLESMGARVLGPFPNTAGALRLIYSGQEVDGAMLDVMLGNEKVFPVADALRARRLPFVFVTGQDDWEVPDVYRDVPRCRKPVDVAAAARALFD